MLGEELLREPTDLDIVTSKTAEILDEHRRRPAEFELGYHVLIAGSVHRDTGDAVVEEVDEVGVSLFLGDLGQQLLLVLYAVAVALKVIVTRKAFIQERCRLAGFTVCLSQA